MSDILASFGLALRLIAGADAELARIVVLSLEVSLAAAILACAIGLPLGAWIAVRRFPGRRAAIVSPCAPTRMCCGASRWRARRVTARTRSVSAAIDRDQGRQNRLD